MAQPKKGWHPEDIKAAIRKTGITLTDLSLRHNLGGCTVRAAILYNYCPAGERVIIDYLGVSPHKLWPERYDEHGNRIIGRAGKNITKKIEARHCQKGEAA